jgi:carbon-monoxide dehydrogenase large subunit
LRLYESAIASRFGFFAKIRSPPTFDFAMAGLADRVLRELKIAPVRRRSFERKDQFSYMTGLKARDGTGITYDSGDFDAALASPPDRRLSTTADRGRAEGRYLGVGSAS